MVILLVSRELPRLVPVIFSSVHVHSLDALRYTPQIEVRDLELCLKGVGKAGRTFVAESVSSAED